MHSYIDLASLTLYPIHVLVTWATDLFAFVLDAAGLETKPKLSDIQRLVKPLVASQWEEVGTALRLADDDDGEQLDLIQEKRIGDCGMCFNDMMKMWLRRSGTSHSSDVTWATLIKAVKSIDGLEDAGARIEAQLFSSSE